MAADKAAFQGSDVANAKIVMPLVRNFLELIEPD